MAKSDFLSRALSLHVAPDLRKKGFSARTPTTWVRDRGGLLQQVWIVHSIYGGSVHLGVACHLLFDPSENFRVYGRAGLRVDGSWGHETEHMADEAARGLLEAIRGQERTFFAECDSVADYRELCTVPSDRQYVLCEVWLKRSASARRALEQTIERGLGGAKERALLNKVKAGTARARLEATYRKHARAFRLS
jgi:hypothetical protein